MKFNFKINYEEVQRGWKNQFKKYSYNGKQSLDAEGYQILEDFLNNHDLNLNKDCFLIHEGRRVAEFQLNQKRQNRLAALDGFTKKLIRREIFERGASLKIEQVSRYNSYLNSITKEMSQFFGLSVSCNLYVTPAFTRCFDPHFDGYHILVLQLAGSKEWKISSPVKPDLPSISFKNLKFKKTILSAGDLLFLPQGAVHEALTLEHSSIHITFGFHPISVSTYLRENLSRPTSNHFFELSRQILIAKDSSPYAKQGLDQKKIKLLTSEFKGLLEQLSKRGPEQRFKEDFLDLDNESKFPLDLDISPSTTLAIRWNSSKIKNNLLGPTPISILRRFRLRSFFYAGELLLNDSTKGSWGNSVRMIRLLLKTDLMVVHSVKPEKLTKPLSEIYPTLIDHGFYLFFDSEKQLWISRIGNTEGYFLIPQKFVDAFVQNVQSNKRFIQELVKKYAKT